MCLIIAKNAGVVLPYELIEQSVADNQDGWGIVTAKDGKLHIERSMDNERFIVQAAAIPVDQPALLHTRIRTKGGKAVYNNHPFAITDDIVMMHNGQLGIDIKFPELSDTWHFAFQIAAPMLRRRPELFGDPKFIALLGKAIGFGNKLAFMRSDGEIMIVNRIQGTVYSNLWMSNTRSLYGYHWSKYLTSKSTTVYHGAGSYSRDWGSEYSHEEMAGGGTRYQYGTRERSRSLETPYYDQQKQQFVYPAAVPVGDVVTFPGGQQQQVVTTQTVH